MTRPRFSVSSLCVLVAWVAVDFGWFRHTFLNGHSTFGFGEAPAFDTGVIPMANVVLLGLYAILARGGRPGPWLIGFEVGGVVAIAAFLILGWTWPDGVRLWLRPIYWYQPRFAPGGPSREYLYLADTVCFLPAQLIIAVVGGFLARWIDPRRQPSASDPGGPPIPEPAPGQGPDARD